MNMVENLTNIKFIITDRSENVKTLYRIMNDKEWTHITELLTTISIDIKPSELEKVRIETKHHAHPDNPVYMKVNIIVDDILTNSQTIQSVGGGMVLMKMKAI